jgi:hypothetical protein
VYVPGGPHCRITDIGPCAYVWTDPVKVDKILNVTVSGAPIVLTKSKLVQTYDTQSILVLVVVPSESTATFEIIPQYALLLVGGSKV